MELLGIDSQEDLFLLMARAHLPMPRLSADEIEAMAQSLHALARSLLWLTLMPWISCSNRGGRSNSWTWCSRN